MRTAFYLLLCSAMLMGWSQRSSNTIPADSTTHAESVAGNDAAPDALPLRLIMKQLAGDMSALTNAMWLENYPEMTARSGAIANHAPISAEEIRRIQRSLGPDMTAFEAVDESVHVAAQRMHEAARARQLALFAQRLGDVQHGCVACHTTFRARLRTAPQR